MKKHLIALACVTAFGVAGTAYAQNTTTDQRSASAASAHDTKLDHASQEFIKKAAIGGMAEVQLGKLAQDKAASPDVKDFGEMMVTDHSKANDQLMQIANKLGATPPSDLDSKHKKTSAKLSKMQGAEFDRAYMDEMLKDHKEDIKLFEKEAKNGKNEELKQFASTTLPTLKAHLQKAQQIHGSLKKGGKGE